MGKPERLADLPSRKAVGSVLISPPFPAPRQPLIRCFARSIRCLRDVRSQYVTAVRRAVSLGIGNFSSEKYPAAEARLSFPSKS